MRNNACFNNKLIKSPLEVICHAGTLIKFWAGLYAEADKKALEDGANLMLKLAMDILVNKKPKLEIQENGNQDAQDGDQPDGWKASEIIWNGHLTPRAAAESE